MKQAARAKKTETPNIGRGPAGPPPRYFVPFDPHGMEDEISLLELWHVLWSRKTLIMGITLLTAVTAAAVSLRIPNQYRAEVLMVPIAEPEGRTLPDYLGGLASLAGVSSGGRGSVEQHLAILKSREFLWEFIEKKQLIPILFADRWDVLNGSWLEADPEKQPSLWDAYRLLNTNIVSYSINKGSGLITVAVEWSDAALAAAWANELVQRLNNHLREQAIAKSHNNLKYLNEELSTIEVADMRQTLYELISKEQKNAMLANTQKEFAFHVLDPAVAPDRKSKPKRLLMVVFATLLGGILGIAIAFIHHAKQNHSPLHDSNKNSA